MSFNYNIHRNSMWYFRQLTATTHKGIDTYTTVIHERLSHQVVVLSMNCFIAVDNAVQVGKVSVQVNTLSICTSSSPVSASILAALTAETANTCQALLSYSDSKWAEIYSHQQQQIFYLHTQIHQFFSTNRVNSGLGTRNFYFQDRKN